MNVYCTYFDQGYLQQGLALWRSLERCDGTAVLWVLALDEYTAEVLTNLESPRLKIVQLKELEKDDLELAGAKGCRSRAEYYFTLSPCWPLWLLEQNPGVDRLIYIDADMLFFSALNGVLDETKDRSVLICGHRFPDFLRHYEKHGRYNVGIMAWRRDENGLGAGQ